MRAIPGFIAITVLTWGCGLAPLFLPPPSPEAEMARMQATLAMLKALSAPVPGPPPAPPVLTAEELREILGILRELDRRVQIIEFQRLSDLDRRMQRLEHAR